MQVLVVLPSVCLGLAGAVTERCSFREEPALELLALPLEGLLSDDLEPPGAKVFDELRCERAVEGCDLWIHPRAAVYTKFVEDKSEISNLQGTKRFEKLSLDLESRKSSIWPISSVIGPIAFDAFAERNAVFEAMPAAIPLSEIPTKAHLIEDISQSEQEIADSQISARLESEMQGVDSDPIPGFSHWWEWQMGQKSLTGCLR